MDRTAAYIFIIRKTNETLESIGKLSLRQFLALLKELAKQEELERDQWSEYFGTVVATQINCTPQKHPSHKKASDIFTMHGRERASRETEEQAPPWKHALNLGLRIPPE